MKKLLLLTALIAFGIAPPAGAAPILNLDIHHNPTHFHPGGGPATINVTTAVEGAASPATNEVQKVSPVFASAGTYRLSFDPDGAGPAAAEQTAEIPVFDGNLITVQAAAVQSALEALPSIAPGDVDVQPAFIFAAAGYKSPSKAPMPPPTSPRSRSRRARPR